MDHRWQLSERLKRPCSRPARRHKVLPSNRTFAALTIGLLGAICVCAVVVCAVGVRAAGASASASHGETWTCDYTNEGHNQKTAVQKVMVLTVSDEFLIQDSVTKYRLLENNNVGLIAANAYSLLDLDTPTRPVVSGLMIVLEKQTGDFEWIGVTSHKDMRPVHGHCTASQS